MRNADARAEALDWLRGRLAYEALLQRLRDEHDHPLVYTAASADADDDERVLVGAAAATNSSLWQSA